MVNSEVDVMDAGAVVRSCDAFKDTSVMLPGYPHYNQDLLPPRPHSSGNRRRCDECGRSFSDVTSLLRHQQRDHSLHRPYRCHVCCKAFVLSYSLQVHARTHATASLRHHWGRRHHQRHLQDGDGAYACAPCGRAFRHKPALLHHQQAGCHTGARAAVTNATTTSLLTIPQHTRSPAVGCKGSFVCTLCHRKFTTQVGLVSHQRLSHPQEWKLAKVAYWKQGGPRYPCPTCDKVFCHAPSLHNHSFRCRQSVSEFGCRSCDMVFPQASQLLVHRREQHGRLGGAHTYQQIREGARGMVAQPKKRGRAHPCLYCNKVFSHQLPRWAHMRKYHAQEQESKHNKILTGRPRGRPPGRKAKMKNKMHMYNKQDQFGDDTKGKNKETNSEEACSVCCSTLGSPADVDTEVGAELSRIYHCQPCRRAFRRLQVFLEHCQTHLTATEEDTRADV